MSKYTSTHMTLVHLLLISKLSSFEMQSMREKAPSARNAQYS